MKKDAPYDVLIIGGGFAGLTLALQLKQAKPGITVLVLEKQTGEAPIATHKVGESTSELGSSYLREVLNLKEYLTASQLPKYGFRFFFSPEVSQTISRRVEVGSRISNPYPTHQIDRGLFENDLKKILLQHGVELLAGTRVVEVNLSTPTHTIKYESGPEIHKVNTRWLIDASGRSSLLKRKLGLVRKFEHNINAAWFRINHAIDIDDWSTDTVWRNQLGPGRRRLATNHLMGEGYWVWIIPLVSGCTSFGIVADPKIHSFNTFNTFTKAMQWLERYEPLAARMLSGHKENVLDFKVMHNFAYDCKQFYSVDRWALTGESGAFLDAFYSPGTDFIALGNTWITDLIVRELNGEDIKLRTMIYEHTHHELLKGWIKLYQNQYGIFGKTQIMLMKIIWDWASYWAIPNVMFMNNGYTDIGVLKQYSSSVKSIGRRFAALNEQMQMLFQAWGEYPLGSFTDSYHNVFDLQCLYQFQEALTKKLKPENVMEKVGENLQILEWIGAEIFRMASYQVHGTPENMNVDPYSMSLQDGKEMLLEKSANEQALKVVPSIKSDIARMWLGPVGVINAEYV